MALGKKVETRSHPNMLIQQRLTYTGGAGGSDTLAGASGKYIAIKAFDLEPVPGAVQVTLYTGSAAAGNIIYEHIDDGMSAGDAFTTPPGDHHTYWRVCDLGESLIVATTDDCNITVTYQLVDYI